MFSARLAKINQWISLLTVIKKEPLFSDSFWYRVGDSNPCFDSESVVT